MQRNMDTIQFETRTEVQTLIGVVEKYVKEKPKEKDNTILRRFYDYLDVMDMEW